jgi:hypothetical protein
MAPMAAVIRAARPRHAFRVSGQPAALRPVHSMTFVAQLPQQKQVLSGVGRRSHAAQTSGVAVRRMGRSRHFRPFSTAECLVRPIVPPHGR